MSRRVEYERRDGRMTVHEFRARRGHLVTEWCYSRANARTALEILTRKDVAEHGEERLAAESSRRMQHQRQMVEHDRRVEISPTPTRS